jgi:hypothetical protein
MQCWEVPYGFREVIAGADNNRQRSHRSGLSTERAESFASRAHCGGLDWPSEIPWIDTECRSAHGTWSDPNRLLE